MNTRTRRNVRNTATKKVEAVQTKSALELVFALRHGEYDDRTKELDSYGRQQAQRLGERIGEIIPAGTTPLILTSPYKRAQQTADIIASRLGSTVQVLDPLAGDQYEDGHRAYNHIVSTMNGAAVIIAVTHFEAPSGIVHMFAQKHFKKKVNCAVISKGDGMMINLSTGEVVTSLLMS